MSVNTSGVLLLVVAMSATFGLANASTSSISSSPSSYRRSGMLIDFLNKKRGSGGIDVIAPAAATYEDHHDCDETEVEMEEECVTSFYRRVRDKRRALLNGPQFDEPRSVRDDDYLLESSLDSLAAPTCSSTSSNDGGGSSSMARNVRGGGGGTSSRRPRPRLLSSSTSLWGMPSGERHCQGEGGDRRRRRPADALSHPP
jgi:hypothetical protein